METVVEQKESVKAIKHEKPEKSILIRKKVKRTMIYCKQTNKIIGTKVVAIEDDKEDSDEGYVC